ncbi:hypothetical protein LTR17_021669 [Elasticomyces elasticus]|nr:hypothetical protein LTR17_021669 [Elasticomyces elasticus]
MGETQRRLLRLPNFGSGTRTPRPEDYQGNYKSRRAAFIELADQPRRDSPIRSTKRDRRDPFTLLDTQSATSYPPYRSNLDADPRRGGSSSAYAQSTGYSRSSSSADDSRWYLDSED